MRTKSNSWNNYLCACVSAEMPSLTTSLSYRIFFSETNENTKLQKEVTKRINNGYDPGKRWPALHVYVLITNMIIDNLCYAPCYEDLSVNVSWYKWDSPFRAQVFSRSFSCHPALHCVPFPDNKEASTFRYCLCTAKCQEFTFQGLTPCRNIGSSFLKIM